MAMSNVLVVAEVVEGKIRKATLSAVTFAREVAKGGGSFSVLVLGASAKAAAAEVTALGASKVIVVEDASLSHQICEAFAPTIAQVAKAGFDVVVVTASSFGKD